MLFWLLTGFGAAALFATMLIRNAEQDDKKRKLGKKPSKSD